MKRRFIMKCNAFSKRITSFFSRKFRPAGKHVDPVRTVLKYSFLFSLLLSIVLILPFGIRQYREKHSPRKTVEIAEKSVEITESDTPEEKSAASSSEEITQDIPEPVHFDIEEEINSAMLDREQDAEPLDLHDYYFRPAVIPEVSVSDVHEAIYEGANGLYSFFASSDISYFDDALFIGDSRTEGIRLYSGIDDATYFSFTGLNVYAAVSDSLDVPGIGNVTLQYLLENYTFGKVYVMLGINEIGDSIENISNQFYKIVKLINETQPEAIIFVEGNMHVGPTRNKNDSVINNYRLNSLNYEISKLANNRNIFYIDVNEVFDDENGCLRADITSDDTHIYAKHYEQWKDWFLTKTVVR